VSTARVLARVAAGFAAAGLVLAGATLALLLLVPAEEGTGPNIGGGFLLLLGLLLLALGAVIGLTALVARALQRRR